MNAIFSNSPNTLWIEPSDLHELVRGQENALVERLRPVVEAQDVTLDLAHVERIDAAGIAALISLYSCARNAGHAFNVAHVSHHVEEILNVVGLDRILLSQSAVPVPQPEACMAQSAA